MQWEGAGRRGRSGGDGAEGAEQQRHSHSRQGAVFLGLLLLPGVAEVQSGLVHAEQLADPVPAVEVPVLVHDLRAGEAPTARPRRGLASLCTRPPDYVSASHAPNSQVHLRI